MEKAKKIILILGITISIIVLVIIFSILFLKFSAEKEFIDTDGQGLSLEESEEIKNETYNKLNIVENKNTYYSIENVTNKYVNSIKNYYTDTVYNQIDGEVKVTNEEKEQYFEKIKQMYVTQNLTDNDLIKKISVFKGFNYFWIDKMYMYQIDDNKIIYPIDGYIVNEDKSLTHILLFIQVDLKNNIFNILQEDYNENIEETIKNIEFGDLEKNTNNIMTYLTISDTDWIEKCFNDYKQKITGSPEYFYNKLDEEYRNKRFENKQEFEEYVKNNYATIYSAKINKYKKTEEDTYTEYIYIDQYGCYYIMKETNPLEYTMMLDSYTIDRTEFIEKYDNGEDKTKVELNIGKFIEALNTKDYEYIYNHLDEEFKNNNYKTVNDLEKYITTNFYDKNSISLDKYEEQNGIYIYDLNLKNAKNESESKALRIVLELEDNRNFVMSFSME